jgi:hypothetical protein
LCCNKLVTIYHITVVQRNHYGTLMTSYINPNILIVEEISNKPFHSMLIRQLLLCVMPLHYLSSLPSLCLFATQPTERSLRARATRRVARLALPRTAARTIGGGQARVSLTHCLSRAVRSRRPARRDGAPKATGHTAMPTPGGSRSPTACAASATGSAPDGRPPTCGDRNRWLSPDGD